MSLKRTHIFQYHQTHAHLVDFAGFEMPLWYKGTISECHAVRERVGLFDVSHMGRAMVSGPESTEFLNYVTTNDVSSLEPMQAIYSLLCNPNGGIIDDIIIMQLSDDQYLVVYNAGNRDKDQAWLQKNASRFKTGISVVSDNMAMFALQGPGSSKVLGALTGDTSFERIKRFGLSWMQINGRKLLVSRTGYTGEDGFEVFIPDSPVSDPSAALLVWELLLRAGEGFGIEPCGLGARDVLRLEAGICLYGNDIDESKSPLEAKLRFAVKLDKGDFIGKASLVDQKNRGVSRSRVGLRVVERGIPRAGCEIIRDNEKVGTVTSGTFSPIIEAGIAMGYVDSSAARSGETLQVRVHGKDLAARVTKFPFYDVDKYGWQRKS